MASLSAAASCLRGENFHQAWTTYSFISSDLDSRSQLASLPLCSFASIPGESGLRGNGCIIVAEGRPLAASREQRAASREILRAAGLHQEAQMIWAGHQRGHIKERQCFKSSALTFMTSVYARSCTLTSTSFTFFLPFFLSFSSGSKGRMCQTVMYLVC